MHCVRNSSLSLCFGIQQPDTAPFFYTHLFFLNSFQQLRGSWDELMVCSECGLSLRTPYRGFGFRSWTRWWLLSVVTQDLPVYRTKLARLSVISVMGENLSFHSDNNQIMVMKN